METGLRMATAEMLVLRLLLHHACSIPEMHKSLAERGGGVLVAAFPYATIIALLCISAIEEKTHRLENGRTQTYYRITAAGVARYECLKRTYVKYTSQVAQFL